MKSNENMGLGGIITAGSLVLLQGVIHELRAVEKKFCLMRTGMKSDKKQNIILITEFNT